MNPINIFGLVVNDWMKRRPTGKPFFFVQVGAHDGKNLDPIYRFATENSWTGLLIEPQPEIYKRLLSNYEGFTRDNRGIEKLWFLNAAVADEDGEKCLYRFKDGQGLPDHATMLASFNRRAIESNGHGYRGKIEEIQVPTWTAESIASKYPLNKMDLLQVDAEGFDSWIVLAFLKIEKPAIIHFENHPKGIHYFELLRELEFFGYRITEVGVNTVCYRQPRDSAFELEQKNEGYP